MINKRMILKGLKAGVLMLGLTLVVSQPVKADYVNDEVNGVDYENTLYATEGYAYKYANGGGSYTGVYLSNSGDRVMNVKSSSPDLIAKKTREYYHISKHTYTDYEYDDVTGESKQTQKTEDTSSYGSTEISVFAKKKGTYTVTFDVVKNDGTVRCTKTIKVKTTPKKYVNAIKSIKYAGKDLGEYYPYTTKTSGKLSVQAAKGFKIKQIEIGTTNAEGETVYKKIKNNKTIKLAKKTAYSRKTDYSTYSYNELFPVTEIKVTMINNKTKEEDTYYNDLATINKK